MLRVAARRLHKQRALTRPGTMDAAAPHSPPARPTPPQAKRRRPDAWGAKRVSSYLTVGRPWEAVAEYWAAVVSGTHQLEDLVRSALPEPQALALPNPPQPAGDAGPKPEHGAEWREQRTFRVEVAYLGPAFGGWQWQPEPADHRSVQGTIQLALAACCEGHRPRLACAGRTDAGVSAAGQVFSFCAHLSSWRQCCSRALELG